LKYNDYFTLSKGSCNWRYVSPLSKYKSDKNETNKSKYEFI
jgi:hypothetical protein